MEDGRQTRQEGRRVHTKYRRYVKLLLFACGHHLRIVQPRDVASYSSTKIKGQVQEPPGTSGSVQGAYAVGRLQGSISSGWFKHTDPLRTYSNHIFASKVKPNILPQPSSSYTGLFSHPTLSILPHILHRIVHPSYPILPPHPVHFVSPPL